MRARRVSVPALARHIPDIRLIAPKELPYIAADLLWYFDRLNRPDLTDEQFAYYARQAWLCAKNAAHFGNMVLNNFRPVREVLAELDAPRDSGELHFKA